MVRASELGDGHYSYIMPAAYFAVGEVRHAYFVGFAEARGDQHVFHATSVDGVDWTIDSADPFASLGIELSPPGPIPTSVIQVDGAWVMYLWGVPAPQFDQAAIWRATATDPGGPWTADMEPVLRPGATGSWDDRGLDFPAVAPTSDGFVMLYSASGGPQPDIARIGRASSDDGIHWERGSEPVAERGLCSFDVRYVAQPRILSSANGLRILYDTERRVGAAAADPDASDWRCLVDQPLLSGDDIPTGQGIHTIAVTQTTSGDSVLLESLVESASELWLGEVVGLD
ncbi:MAG: hypothetical protein ABI452_00580 [Candidatus Limnocylindrales bacterium]